MKGKELLVPPDAIEDPNSFEILRLWAANNEQHVTIHPNLNGGAYEFGYMIAQLIEHGALLYSQREGIDIEEAKKEIIAGLYDVIKDPSGNASGSIPTEH
jgi:hypothetical protein